MMNLVNNSIITISNNSNMHALAMLSSVCSKYAWKEAKNEVNEEIFYTQNSSI